MEADIGTTAWRVAGWSEDAEARSDRMRFGGGSVARFSPGASLEEQHPIARRCEEISGRNSGGNGKGLRPADNWEKEQCACACACACVCT